MSEGVYTAKDALATMRKVKAGKISHVIAKIQKAAAKGEALCTIPVDSMTWEDGGILQSLGYDVVSDHDFFYIDWERA